jgi:phage-related minor tail protein
MPYFRKEDRQANRIKGITVEIGGDTTKLSDALKNVNKSIRKTQDQLRDVNKLLKLDPSNANLLVQKQKYLSETISDIKEKLKQEQDALKQPR